jgi:hypothetical protein
MSKASGHSRWFSLVPRAPSRFFSINSLREGYASSVRAALFRDLGSGSYQWQFPVFSIAQGPSHSLTSIGVPEQKSSDARSAPKADKRGCSWVVR